MNRNRAWYHNWPVFIEKGGLGSGNWGHVGRPGKHGGSALGGGLSAIGAKPGSSYEERRNLSDEMRGGKKTPKELRELAATRGAPSARYVKPKVSMGQEPTVHELMFNGTLAAWKHPFSLRREDGLSSIMQGKSKKYYAYRGHNVFEVIPTERSGDQVVGYFGEEK